MLENGGSEARVNPSACDISTRGMRHPRRARAINDAGSGVMCGECDVLATDRLFADAASVMAGLHQRAV